MAGEATWIHQAILRVVTDHAKRHGGEIRDSDAITLGPTTTRRWEISFRIQGDVVEVRVDESGWTVFWPLDPGSSEAIHEAVHDTLEQVEAGGLEIVRWERKERVLREWRFGPGAIDGRLAGEGPGALARPLWRRVVEH